MHSLMFFPCHVLDIASLRRAIGESEINCVYVSCSFTYTLYFQSAMYMYTLCCMFLSVAKCMYIPINIIWAVYIVNILQYILYKDEQTTTCYLICFYTYFTYHLTYLDFIYGMYSQCDSEWFHLALLACYFTIFNRLTDDCNTLFSP